ncbi:hypothetical protein C8Q80DRAFT_47544 [Daedaleopsis nitida]|nr:hypothetical protein C8Q80DRAFT_47544 [Daedaleopsis nitida]
MFVHSARRTSAPTHSCAFHVCPRFECRSSYSLCTAWAGNEPLSSCSESGGAGEHDAVAPRTSPAGGFWTGRKRAGACKWEGAAGSLITDLVERNGEQSQEGVHFRQRPFLPAGVRASVRRERQEHHLGTPTGQSRYACIYWPAGKVSASASQPTRQPRRSVRDCP